MKTSYSYESKNATIAILVTLQTTMKKSRFCVVSFIE